MAIQDDFTIDFDNRLIAHAQTFDAEGRPPNTYNSLAFFDWVMDVVDEVGTVIKLNPMEADTPGQFRILNRWFIDDETMKTLYGGSWVTSNWTYAGTSPVDGRYGITQLRWTSGSTHAPDAADIGNTATDGTSSATGVILAVNTTKRIVWVGNSNANQFGEGNNVTGPSSLDFNIENSPAGSGVATGDSTWGNIFSIGAIQNDSEHYVGQEDDYMGGNAQGGGGTEPELILVQPWWDSDVDFTASTNGTKAGHFDILVKVQEAGSYIDDLNITNAGRLTAFSRQFTSVYSAGTGIVEVGAVPVPIPFASTGYDPTREGYRTISAGTFSGSFTIGEVITGGTSDAKGIITETDDSTYFEYYLVGIPDTAGDLVDFANAETVTGETSTETCITSSVPSDVTGGPAEAQGMSVTFGHATADVDEDLTNEDYAVTIDVNSNSLETMWQWMQYQCRRGSKDLGVNWLPDADAGNEDGEFYKAVGDIYADVDAEGAAGLTEGELVTGSISGAQGVVVAYQALDYVILTAVKGTFVDNDVLGTTNTATIDATGGVIETIVANNAAPFGSFAGGTFTGARGVLLTNVAAADNNNWSTFDVRGAPVAPPTTITLTFQGMLSDGGDRPGLFEVDTSGGVDISEPNTINGIEAVGQTVLTCGTTVPSDVPFSGNDDWMIVIDADVANRSYEFEMTSVSGADVTLKTVTGGTLVAGGASTTVLVDTGQFVDGVGWNTTGKPKPGHMVRDTVAGGWAKIKRRIDDNSIETTPISSGSWATTNAYAVNDVPVALAAADPVIFPFILGEATGASIARSLKYDDNAFLVARVRASSPNVHDTGAPRSRIKPFELTAITLSNADLTVTVVRTDDNVLN
jgi:hypothetical protein